MKIGVPKEIKNHEYRVGMIPAAVRELTSRGHTVFIETKAADAIDLSDAIYTRAGARILPNAAAVFAEADMITFAKGITNGAVPMGGVVVKTELTQAFEPKAPYAIDLFHGYTYTGHPLAAAAGIATLDLYRDEGLFERGLALEPKFRTAVHALEGARHVIDIRSIGLAAAIEMDSIKDAPGKRGYEALNMLFFDENVVVRISGDTIVLIPALIASESEIARMVEAVRTVLGRLK